MRAPQPHGGAARALLKWQVEPGRRSKSWNLTIKLQREEVEDHLDEVPSLRPSLAEPHWRRRGWRSALTLAATETGLGLDQLPEACQWTQAQILDQGFLPD